MKRVCAWCQREMFSDDLSGDTKMGDPVDPAKLGNQKVTHGICPECKAKMDQELEAMKQQIGQPQPPTERTSYGEWVKRRDSLESPPSIPAKPAQE